jgi:hypothetical protein
MTLPTPLKQVDLQAIGIFACCNLASGASTRIFNTIYIFDY